MLELIDPQLIICNMEFKLWKTEKLLVFTLEDNAKTAIGRY